MECLKVRGRPEEETGDPERRQGTQAQPSHKDILWQPRGSFWLPDRPGQQTVVPGAAWKIVEAGGDRLARLRPSSFPSGLKLSQGLGDSPSSWEGQGLAAASHAGLGARVERLGHTGRRGQSGSASKPCQ